MTRPRSPERIDEQFAPRPSTTVHSVEVDGESVVFDQAANRLHVLDPTASLVWQCYDGSSTLDEIAADLADVLGAELSVVRAEAVALTRRLGREGLLDGVAADEAIQPATTSDRSVSRYVTEPPST